ncbi:hypothetical protein [Novipirellula sp.]|uniref:hypothetical protein n=1 Tax=Novipirellula sp. TaxID=2795430 RepID=UPI0035670337
MLASKTRIESPRNAKKSPRTFSSRRLLGQMVEYRHRDPAEHRKLLIESGASDMAADLRLGLDRLFKDSVLAETTNTILDLTGKKARSVSGWLSDNLSLFQRT